jgi:HAD superfamily hydrolase (TIGR01509 family)
MPGLPPASPRAVVFDCDGLLLDTETCWTRAEVVLFARRGHTFTDDHKRALIGSSADRASALLEQFLDLPGAGDELTLELRELVADELADEVLPQPGAAELVAALRGACPLGLASNSPRALVERALSASGMDGVFDVVLAAEEVDRPKPAPDVYLAACTALGAPPDQAIALEDSPTGVAAARAAGMFVIGVPSFPGVELEPDLLAGSLADAAVRRAVGLVP